MAREKVQLRRYLLGDLPDEEMETIDLWAISDAASRDELESAEHDLIEDYLEGSMSEPERKLFDENFLTNDERRENLKLTDLLMQEARQKVPAATEDDRESRVPFLEWLLGGYRPLAAAATVLVIGVVSFVGWKVLISQEPTALEQEYALLNQRELNIDAGDPRSVVHLAAGQFRDAEKPAEIAAGSLSETVLFRLALPYRPQPGATFRLEVVKGDAAVFSLENARVYSTNAGAEVRALLPRSILTRAPNQLKITDSKDPGLVQTYSFVIR